MVAAEQALKQCDEEYDQYCNLQSKLRLREAMARHARTLAIECDFWREKSRIKWIQVGDTKLVLASVKQCHAANFSSRICDESSA